MMIERHRGLQTPLEFDTHHDDRLSPETHTHSVSSRSRSSRRNPTQVPQNVFEQSLRPRKRDAKTTYETQPKSREVRSKMVNNVQSRRGQPLQSHEVKLAQDDADIQSLEKKLGITNRRARPKAFEEDGLDKLLNEAESIHQNSFTVPKRKRSEYDFWLGQKRRASTTKVSSQTGDLKEGNGFLPVKADLESVECSAEEDIQPEEESSGNKTSSTDHIQTVQNSAADSHKSGSRSNEVQPSTKSEAKCRENPYVPPLQAAASAEAYVPPARRAVFTDNVETSQSIRRKLQGPLNRLSESNILSILNDIEKVYREHPRQLTTEILVETILNSVCDKTLLSDTFLILHAGFASALYKTIGPDFGASITEAAVVRVDNAFEQHSIEQTSSKEAINAMALLVLLYDFETVGCELIFDYLRSFLKVFDDLATELILKIVRLSGPQLRRESPTSLRDIVVILQRKIESLDESQLSVRIKFMVETIHDLKNNKMKTGAAASTVTSEHFVHMRKILGTLNARTIKATEPLRVSLQDVRDSDKRGKWWIVGASWRGRDENSTTTHMELENQGNDLQNPAADEGSNRNEQHLRMSTLARQFGLTTPIRVSIFAAIMSSSDYMDGFSRLQKLKLSQKQQLELPLVIMRCITTESVFNPYYGLIAAKLCGQYKLKKAFRFAGWEFLKRVQSPVDEDVQQRTDTVVSLEDVVKVAKFYAYLIRDGSQDITFLKKLQLMSSGKGTKSSAFAEVLLADIFRFLAKKLLLSKLPVENEELKETLDEALERIFKPATELSELAAGLHFFLERHMINTDMTIITSRKERRAAMSCCKKAMQVLIQEK